VRGAVFDEPNLLSAAGLVPVVALAGRVGLLDLADQFLTVAADKGANAGSKVTSLIAGPPAARPGWSPTPWPPLNGSAPPVPVGR
jgi:hypothetical protein